MRYLSIVRTARLRRCPFCTSRGGARQMQTVEKCLTNTDPSPSEAAVAAKFGPEALTFDDVLIEPAASEVLPTNVATATRLTRDITLSIPLISAAMDTV